MTLRDIENGTKFRLNPKGSVWIKLNEQGMDNNYTYCQSEKKSNTRCNRLSFKHKLLNTNTEIITL